MGLWHIGGSRGVLASMGDLGKSTELGLHATPKPLQTHSPPARLQHTNTDHMQAQRARARAPGMLCRAMSTKHHASNAIPKEAAHHIQHADTHHHPPHLPQQPHRHRTGCAEHSRRKRGMPTPNETHSYCIMMLCMGAMVFKHAADCPGPTAFSYGHH